MKRRDFLQKAAAAAGALVVGATIGASLPVKPKPHLPVDWYKEYMCQTWALGIEVTQEAMEDDLYGYYQEMGRQLGKVSQQQQELQCLSIFGGS